MHLSIIIPYRDRQEHLNIFLKETIGKINAVSYDIVIVAQNDQNLFNRGKLLNIGFEFTKDKSDYFCFHDVDMIPIRVDYSYSEKPYHLAINMPQGLYSEYYGGVNLFNKEDFIKINGFSNEFWGWGYEDDDLLMRVKSVGYDIYRRDGEFASLDHERPYTKHKNIDINFTRSKELYDYKNDGLSSLTYKLNNIKKIAENVTMLDVII
jgi:predicted glycosyltransferase involved in capsule biosynthesis